MKKYVYIALLMIAGFPNLAKSEIARATPEFLNAIDNLMAYGDIVLRDVTVNHAPARRVQYHRISTDELGFLRDSTAEKRYYISYNSGDDSLSVTQKWNTKESTQCVAFSQFASNLNWLHTSYWGKGASVSSTNLPQRGVVLATFNDTDDYDGGHTVVVLDSDESGVTVIDQNYGKEGKVHIWKMRFSSSKRLSNPSSYNVVLTEKL
ncbi:BPSL0067 family protein [Pseudoalteromonas maricaloris]|uniref:BPSL0067 family protein n=1 Tax=Pseudoalteromonas maricaloris TaxID=184924 RepID=UPI003C1F37B3